MREGQKHAYNNANANAMHISHTHHYTTLTGINESITYHFITKISIELAATFGICMQRNLLQMYSSAIFDHHLTKPPI